MCSSRAYFINLIIIPAIEMVEFEGAQFREFLHLLSILTLAYLLYPQPSLLLVPSPLHS